MGVVAAVRAAGAVRAVAMASARRRRRRNTSTPASIRQANPATVTAAKAASRGALWRTASISAGGPPPKWRDGETAPWFDCAAAVSLASVSALASAPPGLMMPKPTARLYPPGGCRRAGDVDTWRRYKHRGAAGILFHPMAVQVDSTDPDDARNASRVRGSKAETTGGRAHGGNENHTLRQRIRDCRVQIIIGAMSPFIDVDNISTVARGITDPFAKRLFHLHRCEELFASLVPQIGVDAHREDARSWRKAAYPEWRAVARAASRDH